MKIQTLYDSEGNPTLQPIEWYEERLDVTQGDPEWSDVHKLQRYFET